MPERMLTGLKTIIALYRRIAGDRGSDYRVNYRGGNP